MGEVNFKCFLLTRQFFKKKKKKKLVAHTPFQKQSSKAENCKLIKNYSQRNSTLSKVANL